MAAGYPTLKFSAVAGATFSASDLYKGLIVDSSGHVIIPDSSGVEATFIGTLNSFTATTSGAGVEAVTVQWGPVFKLRMAASTLAAGDPVSISTGGLGTASATDTSQVGVILSGSSGAVNRVVTVVRTASLEA